MFAVTGGEVWLRAPGECGDCGECGYCRRRRMAEAQAADPDPDADADPDPEGVIDLSCTHCSSKRSKFMYARARRGSSKATEVTLRCLARTIVVRAWCAADSIMLRRTASGHGRSVGLQQRRNALQNTPARTRDAPSQQVGLLLTLTQCTCPRSSPRWPTARSFPRPSRIRRRPVRIARPSAQVANASNSGLMARWGAPSARCGNTVQAPLAAD